MPSNLTCGLMIACIGRSDSLGLVLVTGSASLFCPTAHLHLCVLLGCSDLVATVAALLGYCSSPLKPVPEVHGLQH